MVSYGFKRFDFARHIPPRGRIECLNEEVRSVELSNEGLHRGKSFRAGALYYPHQRDGPDGGEKISGFKIYGTYSCGYL